jgi:hypothetical protein
MIQKQIKINNNKNKWILNKKIKILKTIKAFKINYNSSQINRIVKNYCK